MMKFPVEYPSARLNVKYPLECPSNGKNVIKFPLECPLIGQNVIKYPVECPSSGKNVISVLLVVKM